MPSQFTRSIILAKSSEESSLIYKLSIVVPQRRDLGGVHQQGQEPQAGDLLTLGDHDYKIVELVELMAPKGNCVYLQATCQLIEKHNASPLDSLMDQAQDKDALIERTRCIAPEVTVYPIPI